MTATTASSSDPTPTPTSAPGPDTAPTAFAVPDRGTSVPAGASATDQSQAFASRFLAAVQILDTQLATLVPPPAKTKAAIPLDPSTITDRLGDLATAHRTLVTLERQVTDAITTHFLPAYDQYKYLTRLRQLGARIESARASLRAGQKFRFKARHLLCAGPTAAELKRAAEEGREPQAKPVGVDQHVQQAYQDDPSVVRLDKLADGTAKVIKVTVPGADLHMSNMGHGALAIASLPLPASLADDSRPTGLPTAALAPIAPPRALHLHKIAAGSVIYIHCPIDGSVLLESIRDAVVVISACRQLRVHHAHNVVLCVHVVSDPIIEDSSGIAMVAYPEAAAAEAATANGQLWHHPNRYDQVKDFHWLVDSKPSPNWSVADDKVAGEVTRVVTKVAEWVGWGFSAVPADLAAQVKALCPAVK
ncbi:tubulin binding cofactor C-domain-containing protein [Catenaria anguillulae PL171]|uniref:Tubulin binding cofactor C-domain-containing protein n=1 Tax=Catenaria anguillulae PL171 TaxID=765915 RepID=A0A1Y2HJX2_9FUNG|nr:tubulin binding cofactor C-domain-containing protein [Catenaria anguillulae PL171]